MVYNSQNASRRRTEKQTDNKTSVAKELKNSGRKNVKKSLNEQMENLSEDSLQYDLKKSSRDTATNTKNLGVSNLESLQDNFNTSRANNDTEETLQTKIERSLNKDESDEEFKKRMLKTVNSQLTGANAKDILENLIDHIEMSLEEIQGIDTEFVNGEQIAYVECLEIIKSLDFLNLFQLDFDIEKTYLDK